MPVLARTSKRVLTMLSKLADSDWYQAFGYAGEAETFAGSPHVNPVPGSAASAAPFRRSDVALLLGLAEGERDGSNWVCAGRLHDGRWFCLRAGCDNTGWDCSATGDASVAMTASELLRLGMSAEERARCSVDIDLNMLEGADDAYVEREIVALILRG